MCKNAPRRCKYPSIVYNPDFSIFPSLKIIDLSTNKLNGKVQHGIPKSLESLILESNSIEGGILESLGFQ